MAKKQSFEKKKQQLKAQNDQRRAERAKEESALLHKCMGMLVVMVIAEIYFLLGYRYLVQGTVADIAGMATVVEVISWLGLVFVAGGIALMVMRKGQGMAQLGGWGIILGVILTIGSRVMLTIYPVGTTVMCIVIPLLTLAGFVYYLYQREFFFAGMGVGLAGCGMWLTRLAQNSANWSERYIIIEVILLVVVAALLAGAVLMGRNGGKWGKDENAKQVFTDTTRYPVMYAALAFAVAALLVGLVVPTIALYLMWMCIAVLFVLAVYYTIHLM